MESSPKPGAARKASRSQESEPDKEARKEAKRARKEARKQTRERKPAEKAEQQTQREMEMEIEASDGDTAAVSQTAGNGKSKSSSSAAGHSVKGSESKHRSIVLCAETPSAAAVAGDVEAEAEGGGPGQVPMSEKDEPKITPTCLNALSSVDLTGSPRKNLAAADTSGDTSPPQLHLKHQAAQDVTQDDLTNKKRKPKRKKNRKRKRKKRDKIVPPPVAVAAAPAAGCGESACLDQSDTRQSKRPRTLEAGLCEEDGADGVDSFKAVETFSREDDISRALKLWKDNKASGGSIPRHVYKQVREDLKHGKVPPIFHAYVAIDGDKGLFSSVSISSTPVVPGGFEKGNEPAEIPSDAKDYRPHVFTNDSFDVARQLIEEIDIKFKYNEDLASAVCELVNKPASMIGNGVEVTNIPRSLVRELGLDDASRPSKAITTLPLVTRTVTRGAVSTSWREADDSSMHALIGSPGIGKSWSLIYALQQALQYENSCVVYHSMKDKMRFLFVRSNNRIFAWSGRTMNPCPFTDIGDSSNVLSLIDPIEAANGGADFAFPNSARVLYAASNNTAHMKFVEKQASNRFWYVSPPSTAELEVILPVVFGGDDDKRKTNKALECAKSVGNLLRYIVDEYVYTTRKRMTDKTLSDFAKDEPLLHKRILQGGAEDGEINTSGLILSVSPQRSMDMNDETNELVPVDYDGISGYNYRYFSLSFVSPEVERKLESLSREDILSYWGVSESLSSNMACRVENLFWEDLKQLTEGKRMRRYSLKGEKKMEEFQIPDDTDCSIKEDASFSEMGNHLNEGGNSIIRMKEKGELIDFAGPGLCVYQVTISNNHSFKWPSILKLLVQTGHIQEDDGANDEEPRYTLADEKGRAEKIEFHWVVPEGRSRDWLKKNPKRIGRPISEERRQELKKAVGRGGQTTSNHWIDECIEQYALPMTFKGPQENLKK